jgi:hypothetical protein
VQQPSDDALARAFPGRGGGLQGDQWPSAFLELIDDPKLALGKNIRIFIEQEVFSRLGVAERKIMSIAAVFRYPVLIDAFFIMEEEIQLAAGMDKVELEGADYAVSYEAVDSFCRSP